MKQKAKSALEKPNVNSRPSRKPNKNYSNLVLTFDNYFQVFGKTCKLLSTIIVF